MGCSDPDVYRIIDRNVLGQYMDGNVFYKMCVIMTVLAAAILSAERFYFGKEMGRDMPEAFKIGYWLIIAWAVILLIHAAGLAFYHFNGT